MDAIVRPAYVSTYPPRACRWRCRTRALSAAAAQSGRKVGTRVAAITDAGASYTYPQQVRWVIAQDDPQSWRAVAAQINASGVSLVSIQHEFGICGRFERDGEFVDHLAHFLAWIDTPVVTTLHIVLPHPPPHLRAAMRLLHDRSAALVTMGHVARLLLEQEYGLDPARLVTIPHGLPKVRQTRSEKIKQSMSFEGRTILSTIGLLSSGKGIQ
jgi:hypothetical protein